jgi:protease-4
VHGLLIVVKSARLSIATATSLRGLVARARAAGKRVVVHLPNGGGTKETYVAAGADEVLLGPQAELAPVGILATTPYVRTALDRLGLVPEVHARGRYKTAAEPFERASMSEAQREQLEAVLDRLHEVLVRAIADGRKVAEARARAMVDQAPYVGEKAVEAGLVDALAYEDELAKRLSSDGRPVSVRPSHRYLGSRRALRSRALQPLAVIAVIRVHGAIAGASGLPFPAMAIDEKIISVVRLARANPLVRGVILHIDSPGGSALASDRIHHELVRLAAEKPLVACMGSVAASGGYYLAAAAHEIVAQPTTITGSIGVISARLVIEPCLARLGIVTEVLQRGAHARLLDPTVALNEDSKRALDREIEQVYGAFLRVVARGRNRSVDEIEPLAQGRVWTGADAHARGLVDRLGGLEQALEALRPRIGRGADRLRVVVLRAPRKAVPLLDRPRDRAVAAAFVAFHSWTRPLGIDPSLLAFMNERVLTWSDIGVYLRESVGEVWV